MYHWEADQEDFLVLSGEALLIVEGEERRLRPWDFVHCPPGTKHIVVGAGETPSVVLAVGARQHQELPGWGGYTVDEVGAATRRGRRAGRRPTRRRAYARVPRRRPNDIPRAGRCLETGATPWAGVSLPVVRTPTSYFVTDVRVPGGVACRHPRSAASSPRRYSSSVLEEENHERPPSASARRQAPRSRWPGRRPVCSCVLHLALLISDIRSLLTLSRRHPRASAITDPPG